MIPDPPSSLVDAEMINEVRRNVSPNAAVGLYLGFFEEVRNHGLLTGDGQPVSLEALADRAHSLKSNCGTFGLVALANIAREIEQSCSGGDYQLAGQLARDFDVIAEMSISEARIVLEGDS